MATKKSFLEMHEAVGGSYSSPERVQLEQERNQKRQEKTAEINRQAVTQPKRATQEEVTSTGNQKKSAAPSGALPALFFTTDREQAIEQEQLYQRLQNGYDMAASAAKDPDFASKSGYVSTKRGDGFLDRFGSEMAMGYDDLLYEYINNQEEGIRDQIRRQKPNFGGGYDLMSDNEVALYNYYYATGGKEAAQKYLNSIEDTVNQRKGEQLFQGIGGRTPEQNAQVSQEMDELRKQLQPLPDGVMTDEDAQQQEIQQRLGELYSQNRDKTIRELLFGIGAGLDQFGEGLEGAIRAARGEDSYKAPSARQYASGLIRQDLGGTGAKLPEWMGGSSIGQVGYDAVTNIAHMAPSMLASGAANALVPGSGVYVANALVAASSGGSAYQDAINQGYSTNQARNYAAVMGASEAAMQYALGGIEAFGGKISGNVVEKAVGGIGNGVAKAALETGLNMASEGMEEGIQEALEPVFARAFLGKEENVDWAQVAYSAVLGALTAGLMEGPKTFRNSAKADTITQAPTQQADTDTATQQAPDTPLQGEAADPRQLAQQQEQAREAAQAMEQEQQSQQAAQPPATQDPLLEGIQAPVTPTQEQTQQAAPGREPLDRVIAETLGQSQDQQQTPGAVDTPQEAVKPANAALDKVTNATIAEGSVKSQIRRSQETLNAMDAVAEIQTPSQFSAMDKSQKINWVVDKLKPTNYEVDRKGFGVIKFAKKQLKSAFNYFANGGAEEATFEAIPYVLQNGVEISSHADHKGREYGTVTFAAPVLVDGQRGNMAVVVKQTTDNTYKVHRILTPDGSVFNLSDTKIEAEPTPAGESPKNGSLATPISSASDISIPTVGENVNGNMGNSVGSPGIKGTGAAEANFTQKPAYNATLSADNAQPDRASDVRPMELPKTDINGNPVSAVTGNAYGSKITTDELASLMEEPTARGDFSYARITNDQATQTAMDTIAAAGDWESAYNQWAKDVGAGKAGAEMAARGALFLNHFAKEGNKTQWLNTLADMQDLGTNTAQGLQAMRLIRELAPQDKVRFVEMATKRLGQEMGVEFTIDQSLYDAYNSAETDDARNAALDDIQQAVADQIPSTALDKWNALRYTNMLGNLKTNVRNIAGNIGAGAMYRVKDQVAATMEDVLHKATGGKFEKTKSHTVSRELLNACKQDFDNVSGIVSDGGKYGSRDGFSDQFVQGAMEKRRIFKSDNKILNKVLAPMEAYRKGTNWMMNNKYFGDEAFGKAAYARSLAGYLKAHGVADTDLSKVDAALMDKARAYAVQEAQEATFHDNSALARTLSKLKRDTGVVGEGIIPFAKTPANVLTRAYEFSPLGLIDTTATAVAAAKGGGDVTGTDVINSLSKTLTGTAIFTLGAWLKHQGFLTGGPDDDDEKDAFDKLNGDQNYAIRFTVGGKTYNYTFDWLTPAAMPLFMGAQLMDILDKGFENLTFADLENVFTSIADPMLQMSMLQSLNDSLDNIKYTDNNLGQFFINAAVSYLTQGLSNTLVGQIERSTEKNRMTTYVDKNSQLPAWMQRQIGSLSQKIPGWDYQQTEYRNAYGETEENEGGLLYNLLSPGYISEEKSTALSQELYRLNDAGVDGNVFPDTPDTTVSYTDSEGNSHKDYHLTAGEADRLKEVTGKTATTLLSDMIETDLYKAMSDQQKADAVRKVYDYARELGRTEAIDGYQGMDTWMEAAEKNPTKAILDRVVKSGFDDAFDSLTHAWEYDKDPASAVSALEDAYTVYSGMSKEEQKKFKENTGDKVGYFLDAKDAGIDGETFTELYKTYSDIDAQDSDASAKARNWAYYLNKEKAAGHITASQEETLKDSMAYYVIFPADAGKFNGLTEAGLSADSAQKVVGLMDGITGTGKDGTVRNIDKYKAIAGSSLSAKDKEIAFLEYAPDSVDEKYNYAKKNMTKNGKGITIDDFVKAYQVTDEYSKKKEQTDAWQAMGYTAAEANNLYKLYDGKLT